MYTLDELLNRILSHPPDSVVSIVLVAAFAEALVDHSSGSDMAWRRFLKERPVEDAVSLYAYLAMYPSNSGATAQRAQVLADQVLANSLGVRQAVAEEPPHEETRALLERLGSIEDRAELFSFVERHPELLAPNIDAALASLSLGALWMGRSPERADEITQARDYLRTFKKMQDLVRSGTMLARHVTFFEDPARPHPILKNGDSFDVIAMPDLLYLANDRNGQTRLSIPWGDINLNRSGLGRREKSTGRRAVEDLVRILSPFSGEYAHEGLVLTYYDPKRRGEYQVFFRLYGEREVNKLLGDIIARIDDYRLRGGYVRYP